MAKDITIYNKKHQKFLQTSYKVGGNGVAFDTINAFKNYIFFHNIKVTSVRNANSSKILFCDKELYKSEGRDCILSDAIASNANDILVLQNGDHVLQQYKNNKLTSLFSGYHKDANLVVNYQFAKNILNNISFKGFDSNINRNDNQIVIIDFIETHKKVIAKCKTITIDSILSSDEKKQFIREYDDKYSNSIIMHNNNLFYILK
jgi:hypothetical protein